MSNNSVKNHRNFVNSYLFNRQLLASSTLVVGLGISSFALADDMPVVSSSSTTNITATGNDGQNMGSATIARSSDGKTMTVNQSTNRAVIDWNSFDVAAGNRVNFSLKDTTGATLNRISGASSTISGTVQSNGTLYLVNPNGFVFKAGSDVSAKNLVITTQMPNADKFMDTTNTVSNFYASKNTVKTAKIDIMGNIRADENGFLSIIAPQIVVQSGTKPDGVTGVGAISVNLGKVRLIGGEVISIVDFAGDGLMNFELGSNIDTNASNYDPTHSMIDIAGTVSATGGTVYMNAKAAKTLLNSVTSVTKTVKNVITIREGSNTVNVVSVEMKNGYNRNGSVSINATNGGISISGGISAQAVNTGYVTDQGTISISASGGGGITATAPITGNNVSLSAKDVSNFASLTKDDSTYNATNAAIIKAGAITANIISLNVTGRGTITATDAIKAYGNVSLISNGTGFIKTSDSTITSDTGNVTITSKSKSAILIGAITTTIGNITVSNSDIGALTLGALKINGANGGNIKISAAGGKITAADITTLSVVANTGNVSISNKVTGNIVLNGAINTNAGAVTIANDGTGSVTTNAITTVSGAVGITNAGTGYVSTGAITTVSGAVGITNAGTGYVSTGAITTVSGAVGISINSKLANSIGAISTTIGNITISNSDIGALTLGALKINGTNGGNITISAAGGKITAADITTLSVVANTGNVSISNKVTGNIVLNGAINTNAGAVTIANAGTGYVSTNAITTVSGAVGITNAGTGYVSTGAITTVSGAVTIANAGTGYVSAGAITTVSGAVGISINSKLANSIGAISTTIGNITISNSDIGALTLGALKIDGINGGNITISASGGNITANDITTKSVVANTGNVSISNKATGNIVLNGAINTNAGAVTIANDGTGSITTNAITTVSGAVTISASGGDNTITDITTKTVYANFGNINISNKGAGNNYLNGVINTIAGAVSITNNGSGSNKLGAITTDSGAVTISASGGDNTLSAITTKTVYANFGNINISNKGAGNNYLNGAINTSIGSVSITNADTGNNYLNGAVNTANGSVTISASGGDNTITDITTKSTIANMGNITITNSLEGNNFITGTISAAASSVKSITNSGTSKVTGNITGDTVKFTSKNGNIVIGEDSTKNSEASTVAIRAMSSFSATTTGTGSFTLNDKGGINSNQIDILSAGGDITGNGTFKGINNGQLKFSAQSSGDEGGNITLAETAFGQLGNVAVRPLSINLVTNGVIKLLGDLRVNDNAPISPSHPSSLASLYLKGKSIDNQYSSDTGATANFLLDAGNGNFRYEETANNQVNIDENGNEIDNALKIDNDLIRIGSAKSVFVQTNRAISVESPINGSSLQSVSLTSNGQINVTGAINGSSLQSVSLTSDGQINVTGAIKATKSVTLISNNDSVNVTGVKVEQTETKGSLTITGATGANFLNSNETMKSGSYGYAAGSTVNITLP